MTPDATDRRLIAALADGLERVPRPYATLGKKLGLAEAEVLDRLDRLIEGGVIKRLGLVVRHHELGYRANAMAVWDVVEAESDALGRRLAAEPEVTLCYRRRRAAGWPYTLYIMIHGRDRAAVRRTIDRIARDHGLDERPGAVLFSRHRYKQTGARYPAEVA